MHDQWVLYLKICYLRDTIYLAPLTVLCGLGEIGTQDGLTLPYQIMINFTLNAFQTRESLKLA